MPIFREQRFASKTQTSRVEDKRGRGELAPARSGKRPVWSTAAHQPDARAVLQREHPPAVFFALVDPTGTVQRLAAPPKGCLGAMAGKLLRDTGAQYATPNSRGHRGHVSRASVTLARHTATLPPSGHWPSVPPHPSSVCDRTRPARSRSPSAGLASRIRRTWCPLVRHLVSRSVRSCQRAAKGSRGCNAPHFGGGAEAASPSAPSSRPMTATAEEIGTFSGRRRARLDSSCRRHA